MNRDIIAYSDVMLDFIPHPLTGNVYPRLNAEALKQSIYILLSINIFEVPFNGTIGSDVQRYLFELFNAVTQSSLIKRIEWLIGTFETRIKVKNIEIIQNKSEDGIVVTITFKIKALNIDDIFIREFQRVR